MCAREVGRCGAWDKDTGRDCERLSAKPSRGTDDGPVGRPRHLRFSRETARNGLCLTIRNPLPLAPRLHRVEGRGRIQVNRLPGLFRLFSSSSFIHRKLDGRRRKEGRKEGREERERAVQQEFRQCGGRGGAEAGTGRSFTFQRTVI